MKTILLILTLVFISHAQVPGYGKISATKAERMEAARFTLALVAVHDSNPVHRNYILDQLSNGVRPDEKEASAIFEDKSLFKTRDISLFRQIFNTSSPKAKNDLMGKDRIELWLENFAYIMATEELSRDQQLAVLKVADAIQGPLTKNSLDGLSIEMRPVFEHSLGQRIFGAIGPWKCTEMLGQQSTCNCSVGSSWNVSCNNDCTSPRIACMATEDGCGFLGFYSCSGSCLVG
jgi:hypothetical protein